jgi:nitrite reductase/ring-hydroxylating ferredoxin subunit
MPFVRIAEAADIPPGKGALIEREAATLAVFNAGGGRFYAVAPLCPHEDGPLTEGWHGFTFDLTTGACLVDDRLAIAAYSVRVVDGALEVELP